MKQYIGKHDLVPGMRLPPERRLCVELDVSRSALREAFETMEASGDIWRRVGKGTFFGGPPADDTSPIFHIASLTSPAEIMEARLLIEPRLAQLAALKANADEIARLEYCVEKSAKAANEETHELWDRTFHGTIARATKNQILISVYESLSAIRDQVGWGAVGHAIFDPEKIATYHQHHLAIQKAIESRSPDLAESLMRDHLRNVDENIQNAGQKASAPFPIK